MKIAPRSGLGRWSIGCMVAVPILIGIGTLFLPVYEAVPAGTTILQDLMARPGIAAFMLAGFVSGNAAFICGMVAILRKKEHAVLVYLSTLLGFFILLWVLAEVLFPH